MNPTQYRELVTRLEATARTDRPALRRQVMTLIALGYGYVVAIVLLVLLAIIAILVAAATGHGAVLWIKLLIALVVAEWLIVKSLWVKNEPPQGYELAPGAAPALDRRVEEIRAALDAPRADKVLLTGDFNAAVTQVPRFGIFGFPRTYLIMGVPLMAAVEQEQLDAVLAHEFAHLSGSHPKRGLWVYRMSATWQQLAAQLHASRNWARVLFEKFIGWYLPRLRAYGFVMARADEYEADADAARVCGAEAMGRALLTTELRGRNLREQFWPAMWKGVESEQTPPTGAWLQLPAAAAHDPPLPVRLEWLGNSLNRRALDDDTHPSLRDRLLALGVVDRQGLDTASMASRFIMPVRVSAANHYLGDGASVILEMLDRDWTTGVAEGWKQRHDALAEMRKRVNELLEKERAGATLLLGERWELAWGVCELESEPLAIPLLRRVLETGPHNLAQFVLGRALLSENNLEGVEHLRAAMASSPELVGPGSTLLRHFFAQRGDDLGIIDAEVTQYEHGELMRQAMVERGDVRKNDTLVPIPLPQQDIEQLRALARARPEVSEMWVAQKVTALLPETPMVVVVVEPRWWRLGMRSTSDQKLLSHLLETIQLSIDCHLYVIVRNGSIRWLMKKLKKVPASHVFSRSTDA